MHPAAARLQTFRQPADPHLRHLVFLAIGGVQWEHARDTVSSHPLSPRPDGRAPLTVRNLSPPGAPAAALLLNGGGSDGRQRLMLINPSVDEAVPVAAAPLLMASGLGGAMLDDGSGSPLVGPEGTIVVAAGEVKLFRPVATTPVGLPAPDALTAAANPRIAIEAISPSVNGGRFAAKRLVGDVGEFLALKSRNYLRKLSR
jgi:hypothetical protein